MCEFAGTCAKSCTYTIEGEKDDFVKCKGVRDCAIAELGMRDYLDCVLNGIEKSVSFHIIQSTNHDIYTEKATKVALCAT